MEDINGFVGIVNHGKHGKHGIKVIVWYSSSVPSVYSVVIE